MKARLTVSFAALLLAGVAFAADLKSGPQKGDSPKPFNPEHCTGPNTGSKNCLV